MKTAFWICALGVVAGTNLPARAQQFSWHSYTTLTNVRAVAVDKSGNYWAATAGGAFRVEPTTGLYDVYNNINALSTISLKAVAADTATGVVAFGGAAGELDFLTPDSIWHHSLEIKNNEQARGINKLLFGDSLLYIAADYGISSYDPRNFVFISTGKHLGPIPAETRVTSLAIQNDTLYAGTGAGVVFTPLQGANIADPSFWSALPAAQLQGTAITDIVSSNGEIFIATTGGLRYWDGASLHTVSGIAGDSAVAALAASGDTVFAAAAGSIFTIVHGIETGALPVTVPSAVTALTYDPVDQSLAIGTALNGIRYYSAYRQVEFAPNGPGANYFTDLAFDSNGILWAATAKPENQLGNGLFRFDGKNWKTFLHDSTPQLVTNAVASIGTDSLGNIWAGTYGSGFMKIRDSANTIAVRWYNQTNSPFNGIAGSPSYILVGKSVPDASNVQWIVPFENVSGEVHPQLVAYDPERDTMYAFENPAVSSHYFWNIAIDPQGTKWVTEPPGATFSSSDTIGMFYFNERGTLSAKSDDMWGTVSTTQGLVSNTTKCVAVDQDGQVWVGSAHGLNIITNPEAVLTDPSSLHIIRPLLSVFSYDTSTYVAAILVDQLDNKWIGTHGNGVFVLSPDGSQQLAHFTAENSPLLSDDIFTLALDARNGIVYIGTPNGMSSVTNSILAGSVPSALRVGPQPFIIPSALPMSIYGVTPDAEVKIFTLSGKLVRDYSPGELNDLGGGGGWDGKDAHGDWVASGIYFLVRADADGTTALKKLAVIHR